MGKEKNKFNNKKTNHSPRERKILQPPKKKTRATREKARPARITERFSVPTFRPVRQASLRWWLSSEQMSSSVCWSKKQPRKETFWVEVVVWGLLFGVVQKATPKSNFLGRSGRLGVAFRGGPKSNPEKQLSGSKWSFGGCFSGWSKKQPRKATFWVEVVVWGLLFGVVQKATLKSNFLGRSGRLGVAFRGGPKSNPEKQLSGSKWSFGGCFSGWSKKQPRKATFWVEVVVWGLLFGVVQKATPKSNFLGRSGRLGLLFGVVRKATPKSNFLGRSGRLGVACRDAPKRLSPCAKPHDGAKFGVSRAGCHHPKPHALLCSVPPTPKLDPKSESE